MKRVFSREFVIYPAQERVVIFNYFTEIGKKNRGSKLMGIWLFHPTKSSWKRIEKVLWKNKIPAEMATDKITGDVRFVFAGGESLS